MSNNPWVGTLPTGRDYPRGVPPVYTYTDILRRIEQALGARGRGGRGGKFHIDMGMTKDQWWRKTHLNEKGTGGKGSSFTWEELTRLAALLDAPPGWPFIDWEHARSIQEAADALRAQRGERKGPPSHASPRQAREGRPKK